MIDKPMDILRVFPVRKTKKQKEAFRDAVSSYLRTIGYEPTVEKGSMGAKNLVIGNPETAEYLITAHYDTPANMGIPNFVTPCSLIIFLLYQLLIVLVFLAVAFGIVILAALAFDDADLALRISSLAYWLALLLMTFGPANQNNANDNTSGVVTVLEAAKSMPEAARGKVCFILFDWEEAGLIGSASYQKKHKKQTANQVIINLDCVGDGNEIVMFPTKKLRKDDARLEALRGICGAWGEKSIALHEKGFSVYPSDQGNFPLGVGVGAFHRKKWVGLYYSRIHTKKDTVLEESNVNILRAAIVSLITCGAVNEKGK